MLRHSGTGPFPTPVELCFARMISSNVGGNSYPPATLAAVPIS